MLTTLRLLTILLKSIADNDSDTAKVSPIVSVAIPIFDINNPDKSAHFYVSYKLMVFFLAKTGRVRGFYFQLFF